MESEWKNKSLEHKLKNTKTNIWNLDLGEKMANYLKKIMPGTLEVNFFRVQTSTSTFQKW